MEQRLVRDSGIGHVVVVMVFLYDVCDSINERAEIINNGGERVGTSIAGHRYYHFGLLF
jgi:hypothetical protein